MKKISINELDSSYMIFGNKGNVWSGTAHAMKDGQNLCGTPALSTNHAKLNNIKEVGCPDCLKVLNQKFDILDFNENVVKQNLTQEQVDSFFKSHTPSLYLIRKIKQEQK